MRPRRLRGVTAIGMAVAIVAACEAASSDADGPTITGDVGDASVPDVVAADTGGDATVTDGLVEAAGSGRLRVTLTPPDGGTATVTVNGPGF